MGKEDEEESNRTSFRTSLLEEDVSGEAVGPLERLKVVTKWQRISIACICFLNIALGIFYGLMIYQIETQVEDASEVCSRYDEGADRVRLIDLKQEE